MDTVKFTDIVEAHREAIEGMHSDTRLSIDFAERLATSFKATLEWPDDLWDYDINIDPREPDSVLVRAELKLPASGLKSGKNDIIEMEFRIRSESLGFAVSAGNGVASHLPAVQDSHWESFFGFIASNLRNTVRNFYG